MLWIQTTQADVVGRQLADRHYSRKTKGARMFMPAGRMLVLISTGNDAVWGTSWPYPQYVLNAWPTAMICSIFRNESKHLSSLLIRQALAATRYKWPDLPEAGLITFVHPKKVRRKRDPGRCFRHAGFTHTGYTKSGHWVWQALPEVFPPAERAIQRQPDLFDSESEKA